MKQLTMIDFIIEITHNIPLRDKLLETIRDATSPETFSNWFKVDLKNKYMVTDDECTRLYENQLRILQNPHVEPWTKDPNVKGY